MQTVETVLQIDKTVKQTDESEFNFLFSNWRKHFVRAHQWNFLLNGRRGALITPTLYYLLCFSVIWNSQWNIQNEIEKHIVILWFIKCMIWIECFRMKHKYWDQYTVIIVSSSMFLFFNHISRFDFILHRWTCIHIFFATFHSIR